MAPAYRCPLFLSASLCNKSLVPLEPPTGGFFLPRTNRNRKLVDVANKLYYLRGLKSGNMSIEKELQTRSQSKCELCGSEQDGTAYAIPASPGNTSQFQLWLCSTCKTQIEKPDTADANHWRCLNDTIWSEIPAVQVVSWRMLHKIKQFDWVPDLLDIAYLDEQTLEWAKASGDDQDLSDIEKHVDCCFSSKLFHYFVWEFILFAQAS